MQIASYRPMRRALALLGAALVIAIDDSAFGVASVSADGFESPVVFPGAAGAFWAP
jgi:hypothetical protein